MLKGNKVKTMKLNKYLDDGRIRESKKCSIKLNY